MSYWDQLIYVLGGQTREERYSEECDHEWESVTDGQTWFEEFRPEDGVLVYETHQVTRDVCANCGKEISGLVDEEALSQYVFEPSQTIERPEDTIFPSDPPDDLVERSDTEL